MALDKNMTVSNYVKLQHMKGILMLHLERMGLKDQIRGMTDEDTDRLIYMMSLIGEQIKSKDTDEERIEMLISYIICLWTRLIVDYGASLDEL